MPKPQMGAFTKLERLEGGGGSSPNVSPGSPKKKQIFSWPSGERKQGGMYIPRATVSMTQDVHLEYSPNISMVG